MTRLKNALSLGLNMKPAGQPYREAHSPPHGPPCIANEHAAADRPAMGVGEQSERLLGVESSRKPIGKPLDGINGDVIQASLAGLPNTVLTHNGLAAHCARGRAGSSRGECG
jgi:hypothetical protein